MAKQKSPPAAAATAAHQSKKSGSLLPVDSMTTTTAAELVRQLCQKRQRDNSATRPLPEPPLLPQPPARISKKSVDLDEEIRRLEQELAKDDDDDSSDDDDDDSHNGAQQAQILSLSKSKKATIEHLPPSLLPTIATRKQRVSGSSSGKDPKRPKTELQYNAKKPKAKSNPGLEAAVRHVLQGYQPRSAERLPFYCRVCARQYDDTTTFEAHKQDEFHVTAVALERQASTCKLCRKTFTSPTQLTEHLQSKPHRERLQQKHYDSQFSSQRPSAKAIKSEKVQRCDYSTLLPAFYVE
jgi:Zinc-finger of C2H2 type